MSIDIYAVFEHQLQRQDFINVQQRLNNYSIASQVIPLPCPKWFYHEYIGNGRLILPKTWIEPYFKREYEVFPVIDGLALEIEVGEHLICVNRNSLEKWVEFLIDPIRRLALRQDLQSLAHFFNAKQVAYTPSCCLPDFEILTYHQMIDDLVHQQCKILSIETVTEHIKSCQQAYRNILELCFIDEFKNPVTSNQLQSLANLQLALLTLARKPEYVDSLQKEYANHQTLFQDLEIHTKKYSQWVKDVQMTTYQELTSEQLLLINLLSEEWSTYLESTSFSLWKNWKELPFQELAETVLWAFDWEFLDLDDWFEEKREYEQSRKST